MPALILAMVLRAIVEAVRKARDSKPQPLCADCFNAHVQYAANGRRAISCTFAGGVRPMSLDVLYCTDYRARNLPLHAGPIGFVREITPVE
jgi:hypothetical protein